MNKNKLKSGMFVITKNKNKWMVLENYGTNHPITLNTWVLVSDFGLIDCSMYNFDLTNKADDNFNIIEIYCPKTELDIITDDLNRKKLIWCDRTKDCDGCIHESKYDVSEALYGFGCPCYGCKRIAEDKYKSDI